MYEKFFGLDDTPFDSNPDLRFFYESPPAGEAYANLLYGITARKGFVVLTGEAGTGKSTLLLKLVDDLHQQGIAAAFLFTPRLEPTQFLHFVLTDFQIDHNPHDKADMLLRFSRWLLSVFEQRRTAVLIIDDGHASPSDLLEEVRLLTNLETSREKLLQVVIAGRPELENKLKLRELRQLHQRIAFWARTQALTAQQTSSYIAERLRTAGGQMDQIFTSAATAEVCCFSRGIPRLINHLCERALVAAHASRKKPITGEMIEQLAAQLGLRPGDVPSEPHPAMFSVEVGTPPPANSPAETEEEIAAGEAASLSVPPVTAEEASESLPPELRLPVAAQENAAPADLVLTKTANARPLKAVQQFIAHNGMGSPSLPAELEKRAAGNDGVASVRISPEGPPVTGGIESDESGTPEGEPAFQFAGLGKDVASWEDYVIELEESVVVEPTGVSKASELTSSVSVLAPAANGEISGRVSRATAPLAAPRLGASPGGKGHAALRSPSKSVPFEARRTAAGAIPRASWLGHVPASLKPYLVWVAGTAIGVMAFALGYLVFGPVVSKTSLLSVSAKPQKPLVAKQPLPPVAQPTHPPEPVQDLGSPNALGEASVPGSSVVAAGATPAPAPAPVILPPVRQKILEASRTHPRIVKTHQHAPLRNRILRARVPVAPAVGTLQVTSNVTGAQIYIDSDSSENWVAPRRFNAVSPGLHSITVFKKGYARLERTIRIRPGGQYSLEADLVPVRTEIDISTTPSEAEVLIDGKSHGRSPVHASVSPGVHLYRIEEGGMKPLSGSLDVEEGQVLARTFALVPSAPPPNPFNIRVITSPPDATVYADGAVIRSDTPASFQLSPGNHTLIVFLSGFRPVRREIKVPAAGSVSLSVTLQRQ